MRKLAEIWLVPFIILVFILDVVIANVSPTFASGWFALPFTAMNLLAGIGSCFVLWDCGKSVLRKHNRRKVV